MYAYSNPDPANAWFIKGLNAVSSKKESLLKLATKNFVIAAPGYPVDIAILFRSWFLWGFWSSVFQVSILVTVIPLYFMCKSKIVALNISFMILEGIAFLNGLIWIIVGSFWRFSRAGRVASGEFLAPVSYLSDEAWMKSKERQIYL